MSARPGVGAGASAGVKAGVNAGVSVFPHPLPGYVPGVAVEGPGSLEGWCGVARLGFQASRPGVAMPGCEGVMPGCIGVMPGCMGVCAPCAAVRMPEKSCGSKHLRRSEAYAPSTGVQSVCCRLVHCAGKRKKLGRAAESTHRHGIKHCGQHLGEHQCSTGEIKLCSPGGSEAKGAHDEWMGDRAHPAVGGCGGHAEVGRSVGHGAKARRLARQRRAPVLRGDCIAWDSHAPLLRLQLHPYFCRRHLHDTPTIAPAMPSTSCQDGK